MRLPAVALVVLPLVVLIAGSGAQPADRGARPTGPWTCPPSHPIKGNLTTKTRECIYHLRGGAFYDKTKPERCFATEEEAREAGCRRSKR